MTAERVRLVLGTIVTAYLSFTIISWLDFLRDVELPLLWALLIALLAGGVFAVWRFRGTRWLTWVLLGTAAVAVLALLATAEARGEPDFVLAFPFWALLLAILVLGGSEVFRRWRGSEPTRSSGRPGIEIAVVILVLLVPAALRPSIPDEPQRYGLLGDLVRKLSAPDVSSPPASADPPGLADDSAAAAAPAGAVAWATVATEVVESALGPDARISVGAWREEIEGERRRARFRAQADDGGPGRAPRRIVTLEACPDCSAGELALLYGEWFEPFEQPWTYLRVVEDPQLGDRAAVTNLFGGDGVALVWQRGPVRLTALEPGASPEGLARALERAAAQTGLYRRVEGLAGR